MSDEEWKYYIKNQKPPETGDDSTVVQRRSSAGRPIKPALSHDRKRQAKAAGGGYPGALTDAATAAALPGS